MLPENKTVNLRTVADRVGLAPCSISAVLNNTPAARTIPQATKDRIFRAAAELNYRPNLWAQSLRTKRTRMVAVVTSDFGQPAVARVVAAAQDKLQRGGYLLVLGSIHPTEANSGFAQFRQRGIEGVISIGAVVPSRSDLPVASVDLPYIASSDLSADGIQSWLSELGAAAAETITTQIESGSSALTVRVEPKLRPVSFDPTRAEAGMYASERETA